MDVPTVESHTAQQLGNRIQEIAADLRRLASEVADCAPDVHRVGDTDGGSYAAVAARAAGKVLVTVPNLMLSELVKLAAEADVARARGE